jgi:hypothetical protein
VGVKSEPRGFLSPVLWHGRPASTRDASPRSRICLFVESNALVQVTPRGSLAQCHTRVAGGTPVDALSYLLSVWLGACRYCKS